MAFNSVLFIENTDTPIEFNYEKLSEISFIFKNRVFSAKNMHF